MLRGMTASTGRMLGVPQWTTADRLRKIRREAGLTGAEMAMSAFGR